MAHSAADMARHLELGEPCPVCLQSVVRLPEHDAPADLETAHEAKRAAADACAGAQAALQRCASRMASRVATLELQEKSAASLRTALLNEPTLDEITVLVARIGETEARVGILVRDSEHAVRRRAQCELERDTTAETLKRHEMVARSFREDLAGNPTDDEIDVLLRETGEAEEKVQVLNKRVDEASRKRAEEGARLNAASATLDQQKKFAAGLRADLVDAPTPEETAALLDRIRAAEQSLRQTQVEEASARRTHHEAEQALENWEGRLDAAWSEYRATRDRVAEMKPPGAVERNLSQSWTVLSQWTDRAHAETGELLARLDAEVTSASDDRRRLDSELRERCRAGGLSLGGKEDPATTCAATLGAARKGLDVLRKAAAQRERVEEEKKAARARARIAKDLGRHLNAINFGAWLQNQILAWLVQGATDRLRELSSGQYSLDLSDKNEFLVIDHRNADEPRLAKTPVGRRDVPRVAGSRAVAG